MITVTIGEMSVVPEKASEGWINQMFEDARKRGVPLCVQVSVNVPEAQVTLASQGCGGGGGGSRPPNDRERRIIDAWRRRGLSGDALRPGELRSFLNELARLV